MGKDRKVWLQEDIFRRKSGDLVKGAGKFIGLIPQLLELGEQFAFKWVCCMDRTPLFWIGSANDFENLIVHPG